MRKNETAVEVRELLRARVRQLREQRGWSARRLCLEMARYGVTMGRTTLANYENGRRDDLTAAEAVAIALALDVRLADLVVAPNDRTTVVALGDDELEAAELSERLRKPYTVSANEQRELDRRIRRLAEEVFAEAMQHEEQENE